MDYLTVIIAIIIIIALYAFTRLFLSHKRAMANKQVQAQKNQPTDFNSLFAGVPTALDQAQRLYMEQKAAGADEKVLKPLESRINQLQWVQSNEWWLRQAVPYLDSIAKILMRFLK